MQRTDENELPWRIDHDGVTVSVRLTPKGGRDAIDGIGELSDGRPVLLARVRSVPEDGAANQALLRLLAKATGIPASAADLVSGHTSRLKMVRLAGEASRIAEALTALQAAGDRGPHKRGKKA